MEKGLFCVLMVRLAGMPVVEVVPVVLSAKLDEVFVMTQLKVA